MTLTYLTNPANHSRDAATALGDDLPVFNRVLRVLGARRRRNMLRRRYYDGEERIRNIGIAIPPDLEDLMPVVGWPAKAVNVLSTRLNIEGFAVPDAARSDEEVRQIFDLNHMEVGARQAHTAALRDGCAFIAVTVGDTGAGEPPAVIATYTATDASGTWNQRRHALDSALTVDVRNEFGAVMQMSWWTPVRQVRMSRQTVTGDWRVEDLPHRFGRVPVVCVAYGTVPGRPFGTSRITRPVMRLTDHAVRTLLRSEIAAEFFSAPQRYLLGADMEAFEDENGELKPGWESIIGHLLVASRPVDDNGNTSESNPVAGQFAQASMEPHAAELRSVATMFAGESSIPVNYLGIIQDNPASADAIRAAESDLISVAESAQNDFAAAWAEVAILAAMASRAARGLPWEVDDLAGIRPVWRDASTPTKAAQAQSVMTLVTAGVLPPTSEVTYELLGFDRVTRQRLLVEAAERRTESLVRSLADSAASVSGAARDIVERRGDSSDTGEG